MTCGGCKERAEILKRDLPKVRTIEDVTSLTRKLVSTYRPQCLPWMSPPSVNKDGSPYIETK